MNTLDALLWENVLTMPFTGIRVTIFIVVLAIVLLMCTKIVTSRLPLSIRVFFHAGAIAFVPILFITEHALLSRPGTLEPARLRDGSLCLIALSATITYGKGVYLLLEEPGAEPRYVHVVWEVRFAQAMSRALQAQKERGGTLLVGNASCAAEKGAALQEGGDTDGRDGVMVVDNFPPPYPDKIDLEE